METRKSTRWRVSDNPPYIGREQLKADLRRAILGDPRIWIINVSGPGGVGKSALVTEIAYELYESDAFESIIQLTAKETILTQEGILRARGRSLYSLENLFDHIAIVFEEEPRGQGHGRYGL